MGKRASERFTGKVALITGAASGIGKATALKFAAEGAALIIADVNEQAGRAVAKEIADADGRAIFTKTNVTKAADCQAAVRAAVEAFGALHILFNNAGRICFGTVETITEEQWDSVVPVMLKGTFLMSKYAVPAMRAAGGGVIVNSGSTCSFRGSPGQFAYTAAKAAMPVLTREMAVDLEVDQIRVNCVAPGLIETAMGEAYYRFRNGLSDDAPVPAEAKIDWQSPEGIAEAVLFLASDETSDINGVTLPVSRLRLSR